MVNVLFVYYPKNEKDEKKSVVFKDLPFKSNPHIILWKRSRLCSTTDIISMICLTTKLTLHIFGPLFYTLIK